MSTTLKRVHGYLAEFDSVHDLYHAAEHVRDAGYQRWDCHSPFAIHGLDAAMGVKRSKLPYIVFLGGMTGTTTAFLLQYITQNILYPTVVQAKPTTAVWAIPAWFPVMFELTVLFSAFTALFALLAIIGLPRLNHPIFSSKRFAKFSDDAFFVCIEARDPKFTQEGTKAFLEKIGGKNVELVEDDI